MITDLLMDLFGVALVLLGVVFLLTLSAVMVAVAYGALRVVGLV